MKHRPQHKKPLALLGIIFFTFGIGLGWLVLGPLLNRTDDQSSTQPETPTQSTLSCVEAFPNHTLIAQKLLFAIYSDQLATQTETLVNAGIGGVIVMDQIGTEPIRAFVDRFAIAPFVAVDQEGGTVQRYKNNGIVPGAASIATQFTPEQAYDIYRKDAENLHSFGITTNFAPVVDVASRTPSPLPGRIFSSNQETVVTYATQAINASKAAGIAPVIKHFPGLGSATGNTDFAVATTDPLATLKTRDLVPYQQVARLKPDVMVSNAIVPELTDGMPAIWSPAAVDLLRSYGYQNSVVYSDSLTAVAVPGALDDAVINTWKAGVDVAVIVQDRTASQQLQSYIDSTTAKTIQALENNELNRTEFAKSVERIFVRKHVDPCKL